MVQRKRRCLEGVQRNPEYVFLPSVFPDCASALSGYLAVKSREKIAAAFGLAMTVKGDPKSNLCRLCEHSEAISWQQVTRFRLLLLSPPNVFFP